MTRKAIFYILLVFAMVLVVGCESRSSDIDRNGVSNPAQSTKSETSIRNSQKEVTLPGSNKVEPTQVQIRLPKILGQNSDEIRNLERLISRLENRMDKLEREVSSLDNAVGSSQWDPRTLQSDVRNLKRDVDDLKRKMR